MAGERIEKAWNATSEILLGEPLAAIERFGAWLSSETPGWREVGTKSGRAIVPCYAVFPNIPDSKVALMTDMNCVGGIALDIGATPSAESLARQMGLKGKFIVDLAEGKSVDVERCSIYKDLSSAYMCLDCFYSKYVAYDWFCDNNDRTFGCQFTFFSSFCIKCRYSSRLSRCFEMDSCSNCADCLFCHNCESLQNCMFCFNTNSLRYAICNVEVGREEYLRIKKLMLDEIALRLKRDKSHPLSIYNIACAPKGKK